MKFKSLSAGKSAFARRKRRPKVASDVWVADGWTLEQMVWFQSEREAACKEPGAFIEVPEGKQPPTFIQRKP